MLLTEFIENVTPNKVAEQFSVELSTVYRWKNLESVPTTRVAYNIVKQTCGLVSYEEIYDPYHEKILTIPENCEDDNKQLSFPL